MRQNICLKRGVLGTVLFGKRGTLIRRYWPDRRKLDSGLDIHYTRNDL
jgi:hypothetical protein